MKDNAIIRIIDEILLFRQKNPGEKGKSVKTNDEQLIEVKKNLASLKKHFTKIFNGHHDISFDVNFSKGSGNFPHIIHISILPPNQKVSDGIYTVLCFDKKGRGFVAGCIQSVSKPKGLNTVCRNQNRIDVDGSNVKTRYNDAFVNPKEFYFGSIDYDDLIKHINNSIDMSLKYLGLNIEKSIINNNVEQFEPKDSKGALEKINRDIINRKGQLKFRRQLLKEYNNKCAISGCEVIQVLEAAHLTPYCGEETNNIQNGILLRTDLHTLYDLGLITIEQNTYKILIHDNLKGSIYYDYHNEIISLPKNKDIWPSSHSLRKHNNYFMNQSWQKDAEH